MNDAPFESAATQLWLAWTRGSLALQRCADCGRTQHPPGVVCGSCGSRALSIEEISGAGRLAAWSTVLRAPTSELREQLPYTICVVATDEGAFVEVRLATGVDVSGLAVGDRMRLTMGSLSGQLVPIAEQV